MTNTPKTEAAESKDKYWNLKPKKKITGEGIVVSLTEKEIDNLIAWERQQAVAEFAREVVAHKDVTSGDVSYEDILTLAKERGIDL